MCVYIYMYIEAQSRLIVLTHGRLGNREAPSLERMQSLGAEIAEELHVSMVSNL